MIFMHSIMEEILASARKRAKPLRNDKKMVVDQRKFKDIIEARSRENRIPVIAEIKPSSPTRFIRDINPQDAFEIAGLMEAAGAAGISVLTEPQFFKGSIENLRSARNAVKIPVLRKDFIIEKSQVFETECDLILLIAGILGDKLDDFVLETISSGREPLVEVHNYEELDNSLLTDARIIGINNRDLTTMKVDISTTEKLAPLVSDRIIISESGISSPQDAVRMIEAGADAILVGTSIMQGNVYEKTYELVHALEG